MPIKIIVVLGPTASGKSALGVQLAKKLGGEVISADSRQVYKGLDIGSGKITRRQMRGVPHHLLDVASPRRIFSVARFQKLGRTAIRAIARRGKVPIIVGGTGFFIDALLYDYPLPSAKADLRLRAQLEKKTTEELVAELTQLDPQRAAGIDQHNRRRLIRALEIIHQTGQPVPRLADVLAKTTRYEVLKIGIDMPKEKLQRRIHVRLAARLHQGMLKEVQQLRRSGLSWQRLDNLGLEYRFLARYLQEKFTLPEMKEQLEKEIYKYAKRQMTWFKRDKEICWIPEGRGTLKIAQKFLNTPT